MSKVCKTIKEAMTEQCAGEGIYELSIATHVTNVYVSAKDRQSAMSSVVECTRLSQSELLTRLASEFKEPNDRS
jgi:tRNA1(Val) A37 N6-methylase TrmN6